MSSAFDLIILGYMHDVQNDVLLDWPKKAYFWQNFYLTKFKIEKKKYGHAGEI